VSNSKLYFFDFKGTIYKPRKIDFNQFPSLNYLNQTAQNIKRFLKIFLENYYVE